MSVHSQFYAGAATYRLPGGAKVIFEPRGRLEYIAGVEPEPYAIRRNPGWRDQHAKGIERIKGSALALKIMIGMSVGPEPTWDAADIKAHVLRVWSKLNPDNPSFTLLLGEGVFLAQSHQIVEERSAQVIVSSGEQDEGAFIDVAVRFAYALARAFLQESVLLEVTNNNIHVFGPALIGSELSDRARDPVSKASYIEHMKRQTERMLAR